MREEFYELVSQMKPGDSCLLTEVQMRFLMEGNSFSVPAFREMGIQINYFAESRCFLLVNRPEIQEIGNEHLLG